MGGGCPKLGKIQYATQLVNEFVFVTHQSLVYGILVTIILTWQN